MRCSAHMLGHTQPFACPAQRGAAAAWHVHVHSVHPCSNLPKKSWLEEYACNLRSVPGNHAACHDWTRGRACIFMPLSLNSVSARCSASRTPSTPPICAHRHAHTAQLQGSTAQLQVASHEALTSITTPQDLGKARLCRQLDNGPVLAS